MNPSEEPSRSPESQDGLQRKVRKVIVAKSALAGKRNHPVMVRRSSGKTSPTASKSQASSSVSLSGTNSTSHTRVIRRSHTRLGEPDFSQNIITGRSTESIRDRREASMAQKLFFDAAIAVVALSFMVLTIVHL